MNAIYVYSIGIIASLLAMALWILRRCEALHTKQLEILFFLSVFSLQVGTVLGLSSQNPARLEGQQNRNPTLAAAPPEDYAFPERLFGQPKPSRRQPPGPALAYAAPETGVFDSMSRITSGPLNGLDAWTAVYDISAHTVYLPNGTMLEAHSGRGARLDNPRYVHERMRGATPPHVYELALRERLFHGVRALRLKPARGGNIFGRTGSLAHTYMLGPNGDFSGCVVFKDYAAFLQAFENGEVKRLLVVANID